MERAWCITFMREDGTVVRAWCIAMSSEKTVGEKAKRDIVYISQEAEEEGQPPAAWHEQLPNRRE